MPELNSPVARLKASAASALSFQNNQQDSPEKYVSLISYIRLMKSDVVGFRQFNFGKSYYF